MKARVKATPVWRQKAGSASALIILLLVLLIFFGILALVAAAADLRLAMRRAEWNQSYYVADSQAERVLAIIAETCDRPGFNAADSGRQIETLNSRLSSEPVVATLQVQPAAGHIRVEARIVLERQDGRHEQEEQDGQGIEMTVLIEPGQGADNKTRLTVVRWNWWREPFDYDQQSDGVWEG